MNDLLIFDSTLRDGSHALKYQITKQNIIDYCSMMDNSGVYTVIVGHGNGLGASSLQVGLSLLDDAEMIITAKENLNNTKLGVFMIPGFGTIKDNLIPAINYGVDVFCIGCHCTEANTTRQHIEFLRNQGREVYGILMMYHMASLDVVLEETLKMQSYGAKGVILMDSAGASTPDLVESTISTLKTNVNIDIGFHSHNNLGLAVSNAYIAYKNGATIIDGTIRGLGAGAGNCSIELFIALLQKMNINTKINLYKLLDASENVVKNMMPIDKGISDLSIVSGMSGVFSSFITRAKEIGKDYNIDPRDILVELGKQKVVAGQEDAIINVANSIMYRKAQNGLMSF